MTIHVKPEELIKIEEGTIFFRILFQGQWSKRLSPNPTAECDFITKESMKVIEAEAYKFDGEKRVLYATCHEPLLFFEYPAGVEIGFILNATKEA